MNLVKAERSNITLKKKYNSSLRQMKRNYQLYLVILLPVIYLLVFKYYPMYGAQIAFKKFMPMLGIDGSPWVGLKNFQKFFSSYQFTRLITNTLGISFYQLIAGFPIPIILALALNSTRKQKLRKTVQMITYMPHFISTVVMAGIILQFLNPRIGLYGSVMNLVGIEPKNIMGIPEYFKSIYVWSGVWQSAGWGTIIYLATLAGVDPSLHEAATVDGAGRLQRVRHIDIPAIIPTAVILLIMNTGHIMNVGFEKVYLLQNPLNLRSAETISTYVYKVGLSSAGGDFSYSTAIGLFNSIINLTLIMIVNQIAKKTSNTSLW